MNEEEHNRVEGTFWQKMRNPDQDFIDRLGSNARLAPIGGFFLVLILLIIKALAGVQAHWLTVLIFPIILGPYLVLKILQVYARVKYQGNDNSEEGI